MLFLSERASRHVLYCIVETGDMVLLIPIWVIANNINAVETTNPSVQAIVSLSHYLFDRGWSIIIKRMPCNTTLGHRLADHMARQRRYEQPGDVFNQKSLPYDQLGGRTPAQAAQTSSSNIIDLVSDDKDAQVRHLEEDPYQHHHVPRLNPARTGKPKDQEHLPRRSRSATLRGSCLRTS